MDLFKHLPDLRAWAALVMLLMRRMRRVVFGQFAFDGLGALMEFMSEIHEPCLSHSFCSLVERFDAVMSIFAAAVGIRACFVMFAFLVLDGPTAILHDLVQRFDMALQFTDFVPATFFFGFPHTVVEHLKFVVHRPHLLFHRTPFIVGFVGLCLQRPMVAGGSHQRCADENTSEDGF